MLGVAATMRVCGRLLQNGDKCAQPVGFVLASAGQLNKFCSQCSLAHFARTKQQLSAAPRFACNSIDLQDCAQLLQLQSTARCKPPWFEQALQDFPLRLQRMLRDWGFATGERKKFKLNLSSRGDLVLLQLQWTAVQLSLHVNSVFALSAEIRTAGHVAVGLRFVLASFRIGAFAGLPDQPVVRGGSFRLLLRPRGFA